MKISVVIPTYNRAGYLREALTSVAAQTRLPDEVIVSDNHSPEPCQDIVSEFADKLPIRHLVPPRHMLMEAHWLWAFGQATGDYAALLEDDNLWRPSHLQELETAWKAHPQASLYGTAALQFTDIKSWMHAGLFVPPWNVNLLTEESVFISPGALLATALFCNPFASSAAMFSCAAYQSLSLQTDGSRNARDRWLWAALGGVSGASFAPKHTVLYREHPQQAVRGINKTEYRTEWAKTARTILGILHAKGLSVETAFRELSASVSPANLRWAGASIVQTRDRQLMQEIVPHIPGGAGIKATMAYVAARKAYRLLG